MSIESFLNDYAAACLGDSEFYSELTVSSLAALCGISEVYFRKLFFVRFGTSPKDYIISLRTGYAKQLLAYEALSVGQVAEACGYVEPAHFSREFARRVGCAPRDYKEM